MNLYETANILADFSDLKSTDYFIGMATLLWVIKVLLDERKNRKAANGELERRQSQPISQVQELYQKQMIEQHDKMIERLEDLGQTLVSVKAVGLAVNTKSTDIRDDVKTLLERTPKKT